MPDRVVLPFECGYGFFRLLRTGNCYRWTTGKWEIAWLRYIEHDDISRSGYMEQTVDDVRNRLESPAATTRFRQGDYP